MSVPWKWSLALTLLTLIFSLQTPTHAQTNTKSSKAQVTKKTGYSGDPARKRGIEIGFDMGKKAGKADLEQKLKPDPKRHEPFQKPETYHRSEYGSQASFVSGFKSGFMGGYQTGLGKKVPYSATGLSLDKTKPTTSIKNTSTATSSDAL